MTDCAIELAGESLILLPERAVYWAKAQTLFVTDTHWGKDATFRAASLAVPDGILQTDLARLDSAITRTGAARLIVLGDLIHARAGLASSTVDTITAWRAHHPLLETILVRGNHDRGAGDPPEAWRFTCVDAPLTQAPFLLHHEPTDCGDGYPLAGHLHPAVRLNGAGRQHVKLPCFWFRSKSGVLPAFGGFIDHAIVTARRTDRVYVPVEDEVLAVHL